MPLLSGGSSAWKPDYPQSWAVFCHGDSMPEVKPDLTESPFILSYHFRESRAWPPGPVAFNQACGRVWTSWMKGMEEKSLLLHSSQEGGGERWVGRGRKRKGRERMSFSYTLQRSPCPVSSFLFASQSPIQLWVKGSIHSLAPTCHGAIIF